jgi:hypothetical protein
MPILRRAKGAALPSSPPDNDDLIRVESASAPSSPGYTLGSGAGASTASPATALSRKMLRRGLVCRSCKHLVSRCHTCGRKYTDSTAVRAAVVLRVVVSVASEAVCVCV